MQPHDLDPVLDHYIAKGSGGVVDRQELRGRLWDVLPATADEAMSSEQIRQTLGSQTARRSLQRALGDLCNEGRVLCRRGAGHASYNAPGYWLDDGGPE
jgi:hypothetical protein